MFLAHQNYLYHGLKCLVLLMKRGNLAVQPYSSVFNYLDVWDHTLMHSTIKQLWYILVTLTFPPSSIVEALAATTRRSSSKASTLWWCTCSSSTPTPFSSLTTVTLSSQTCYHHPSKMIVKIDYTTQSL